MATTEKFNTLISSYVTSDTAGASSVNNAVGLSPGGNTGVSFEVGSSSSASAYVEYAFDTSAVPNDVSIESVTCIAGGYTSNGSYFSTYVAQLYSGSTAKGSTGNLKTSGYNTTVSFDGGVWTRDELKDCRIRFSAKKSKSGSGKECVITGADLTVTYTYQSEKFMLKLGGAWHDIARVFKKVSGIWVEQESLEGVVDTSKKLVNGGEIN